MVKDVQIGSGDSGNSETIGRSPPYKKSAIGAIGHLIPNVKTTLIQLSKAFTKALIFYYFDPKYYIQIKTTIFGYAINEDSNQLALDNISQQYSVANFLRKIILAKT